MKAMELAIILTAYDKATRVINSSVNAMETRMRAFNQNMIRGSLMVGAGIAGANILKGPIKAMETYETAAARLRMSMMKSGGILDTAQWEKANKLALQMGADLPGTNEDMLKMMEIMKHNGVDMETVLGGTAQAAADLAIVNQQSYERTAEVFAHIHNAVKVAGKDMPEFADLLNRAMYNGGDLTELENAFSRSGTQIQALGLNSSESRKQLMALFTTFITMGSRGQTVGTNFSRIWSEMLNPTKYALMQRNSMKYLKDPISFLDSKGNFKGIQSMLGELNKMRGLSYAKVADILSPLTGNLGLDDTMLKFLARGGIDAYNKKITDMFQNTATLKKMQQEFMQTPEMKWERAIGNFHNMLIQIGETLKPILMPLYDMLAKVFNGLGNFVKAHPTITKWIGSLIAIGSGILMVSGAFKILRAVMAISGSIDLIKKGFGVLKFVFLVISEFITQALIPALNGIAVFIYTVIIPAISSAAAWFGRMAMAAWAGIMSTARAITTQLIPAIMRMGAALLFNPWTWIVIAAIAAIYLIIKYWSQIKEFFINLWHWLSGMATRFYNAGKNIIMSIWNGMKAVIRYPIEAIKGMVQAIRDYLPFSPAKIGPLRDIHRIKLIETIAANIKSGPMLGAMSRVGSDVMNYKPNGRGGIGGGGMTVNYAPVMHFGAGSDKGSIMEALQEQKREVIKLIEDTLRRQDRVSY